MEQKRFILAIALSAAVFMVWNFLFPAPKPEVAVDTQVATPVVATTEAAAPAVPVLAVPRIPDRAPTAYTVTTPLYTAVLSDQGADIRNFKLHAYMETTEEGSLLKDVIDEGIDSTFGFQLANNGIPGLEGAMFTARGSERMNVSDTPGTLVFSWQSENGFLVEKRYTFRPDTYLIDMDVVVRNTAAPAISDRMVFSLKDKTAKKRAIGFEGPSALIGKSLEQVKPKKIEDQNRFEGPVKWVALQDRYFMSAIAPQDVDGGAMVLSLKDDVVTNRYETKSFTLNPGTEVVKSLHFYAGPKSIQVLKDAGFGLEKSVDFGMFDILAKPLLLLLNFIHSVLPNYGIAIILLTLIVKGLLWPLGTKSYRSMNDMKKLQPLMAEIREKYGDDKERMNQETMQLYKTYKVNPMSGCLPLLAQMPIFLALYRMLYEAIELRHAPFFGWILDLSAPDRLFEFGFSIPFMQAPYGVPVLTIIMGATMFLQQKMSPPAGDPTQAKMMLFMPIIFTVIFINFPAGLVLYWLVNNVVSVAQQYYIMKTSD